MGLVQGHWPYKVSTRRKPLPSCLRFHSPSETAWPRGRLDAPVSGNDWPMARVGLCLGAGGLVGQAYQAGVLTVRHLDLGWDARDSELVIGTSAGAVTGAMLRLGVAPFDLASWVLGRPWEPDQTLLDGLAAVRHDLPTLSVRTFLRPWRMPPVRVWISALSRPWSLRPLTIFSSMLPVGRTAMEELVTHHLGGAMDEVWPNGLWICATRLGAGSRAVFGRQADEPVRLSSAIAASSSIPGYFAPVTIGGEKFLDGGIHSPTNADLMATEHLDVAIIVSPMSGGAGQADRLLRSFAQRRLRSEIAVLERAGTKVVLFEPGPNSSRAMGLNPMATDGLDRVLQAAFFEAGASASQPEIRRLLQSRSPAG